MSGKSAESTKSSGYSGEQKSKNDVPNERVSNWENECTQVNEHTKVTGNI